MRRDLRRAVKGVRTSSIQRCIRVSSIQAFFWTATRVPEEVSSFSGRTPLNIIMGGRASPSDDTARTTVRCLLSLPVERMITCLEPAGATVLDGSMSKKAGVSSTLTINLKSSCSSSWAMLRRKASFLSSKSAGSFCATEVFERMVKLCRRRKQVAHPCNALKSGCLGLKRRIALALMRWTDTGRWRSLKRITQAESSSSSSAKGVLPPEPNFLPVLGQ